MIISTHATHALQEPTQPPTPRLGDGQENDGKASKRKLSPVWSPVVDQPGGLVHVALGFKLPCGPSWIEPVKDPCLSPSPCRSFVSVCPVGGGVIAAGEFFLLLCFTGEFSVPLGHACSGVLITGNLLCRKS